METKIRKPYEAQLDEDREFYSAAHRTGYDQGFTAGIDYQICLEQSLGVFSKDSQIYHLGNRIGELNAIVSDANTALEALVAERTELQTQLTDALAQLTQLRSQTIAREDRPQHDPLAELLKMHYRLGPDDVMEDTNTWIDARGRKYGINNDGHIYRPIPTNIPLPEGAVIPDGWQALPVGEMAPEGALYWSFEGSEWRKIIMQIPQHPAAYYIRPAKEVSNG